MLSEIPCAPILKPIPPRKVLPNSPGVFMDRILQRSYKIASSLILQNPNAFSKLKHLLQWAATLFILTIILFIAYFAANIIVFGGPLSPDSEADQKVTNTLMTCRNTVQGKKFITDDKGYVCKHEALDRRTGCCKDQTRAFSCPREYCNTTSRCCSIYEYCVACCMDPQKNKIRDDLLEITSDPIILGNRNDIFELCRSVCRTSSKSLHSQKEYRNDEIKHCFGARPPPLLNETESGQIRIKTGKSSDIPLNNDEEETHHIMDVNELYNSPSMRVSVARSSGSIRLNTANGIRIVLLTILLFQLLLPMPLEKRPKRE